MTTLVLTVVGSDRAGLVSALADVVGAHGGNWEDARLAELDGTFAGVVRVAVPAAGVDALRAALAALSGLLTVTVHDAVEAKTPDAAPPRPMVLHVLGNDRPGIVREISGALSAHGVSIAELRTRTSDAAMSGGRLFEADVHAVVPAGVDLDEAVAAVERIAAEIQVDVTRD